MAILRSLASCKPAYYTIPSKFAPPLGVYESDYVRVEWQKMDFRQPFYRRNADVDEISYHMSRERTFMSEQGSIDLTAGDFLRIPVSVAHDNRGVEDVHMLFYISAPVTECVAPSRTTEHKMPPFPGWEPEPSIAEVMTECLGAVGCNVWVSLADEQMLLDAVKTDPTPINVLRASTGGGSGATEWLSKSTNVWLGSTTLINAMGDVYKRHRRADEIQCQVRGRRTLVTQRGTILLEPGGMISVPLGTAFTDVVHGEESTHHCLDPVSGSGEA